MPMSGVHHGLQADGGTAVVCSSVAHQRSEVVPPPPLNPDALGVSPCRVTTVSEPGKVQLTPQLLRDYSLAALANASELVAEALVLYKHGHFARAYFLAVASIEETGKAWAAGGPQKYTGRSMRDSHQHLNITPKEWDAFMDDFQQTLDKFKVPAAEQAELKAIVQSTYGDIVIGKS